MAELDLAAPVGKLLCDHAVAAGPAIVQGVRLSARIGAAAGGHDQRGEMFVPGAARAVVAGADASGPRCADGLEFIAPAAREIDHLVGQLRAGQGRRGQPVAQDRLCCIQRGLGGDDSSLGIGAELEGQGQPKGGVSIGQR